MVLVIFVLRLGTLRKSSMGVVIIFWGWGWGWVHDFFFSPLIGVGTISSWYRHDNLRFPCLSVTPQRRLNLEKS